jgi:surfactin synthase thioesterase subunit
MVSPPVRLVLLHHAGGSRLFYRGWERWLPASWEVLALDAPGRGFQHGKPAVTGIGAMVDFVLDQVVDGADRPVALFGHSMGALVAAEVTNRLLDGAGPAPVWLGLSGWDAQRPAEARVPGGIATLSDDDLRAQVLAMGGTPAQLLADPELWRLVGPLLRADLSVVASYDPAVDRSWLNVPLSLFGGRDDRVAPASRLTELAQAADRPTGLHLYQGGHFYLTEHAGDVARRVSGAVRSTLAGAMTSRKGV